MSGGIASKGRGGRAGLSSPEMRAAVAAAMDAGEGIRAIAARTGYSPGSVQRLMSSIRVERGVTVNTRARLWTPAEDAILMRALRQGATVAEATALLPGRRADAVKHRGVVLREEHGLPMFRSPRAVAHAAKLERARGHLAGGLSIAETARRMGISKDHASALAAEVRAAAARAAPRPAAPRPDAASYPATLPARWRALYEGMRMRCGERIARQTVEHEMQKAARAGSGAGGRGSQSSQVSSSTHAQQHEEPRP